MSHATVLVISNKNNEKTIEKMMYPYWELDLCLEDLMKDSRAKFEPEMTIEEAKILHAKKTKEYPEDKYNEMTLETFMRKWNGNILRDGKFGYFHNPNDKWDWYQIGGRWAGKIKLKDNVPRIMGKKGEKSWTHGDKNPYQKGLVDSAKFKDIDEKCLKNLVTFAVLNEKGWHEKSKMGWFGVSSYEKYCCVAEELTIREVIEHFKHDYFGISKPWKGISNEYIIDVFKVLHEHYTRDGKVYKLKNNLGNGKTEITDGLKQCDFFRNKHWSKNFYGRFIENLNPDMYLTIIDYHI